MLHFTSEYLIAIDIRNSGVYAAQLTHSRQGLSVRELAYEETNEEGLDNVEQDQALAAPLRKLVKGRRFAGKRVIAHIPPQSVFSFPLHFQLRETEPLEEAILRESREYLPFPLDEAVIDYPSIAATSSGETSQYRAMIVAVRTEHIEKTLGTFKRIGLTVEAVDLGISSLVRLHKHLYSMSDHPVILCNIGRTQSLLSVVTQDRILAQRYVPWGTQILHKKIRTNLELSDDDDKAEILVKEHGLMYDDRMQPNSENLAPRDTELDAVGRAVYQIIVPHVDELVYEFHKIIGYVRSEEQNPTFEGNYMYGESVFVCHLDRYLERRLNIPTKLINPMTAFPLSDDVLLPDISEGAPFALALGLAMRKVKWF